MAGLERWSRHQGQQDTWVWTTQRSDDKVDPLYGGSTLQLQSAFMVKGWSRSVAGLTVLLAAYELRDDENSLLAVPQLHTVSLLTS